MGITIASYGGGTNSTAMLIECARRSINVDLILFADTGGERPHTYSYVKSFSMWLRDHGMPEIITVKGSQPRQIEDGSLEAECLRLKTLPSRTYGFGSCSMKWKRDPQDTYVRKWPAAVNAWEAGEKVLKLIGFDADEPHRAERIQSFDEPKFSYRCPLVDWDMGRDECIKSIEAAGLCLPGKSACFYCPSSKPIEVRQLAANYPELAHRALVMEANANLTTIKGLGRRWAWKDLLAQGEMLDDFASSPEMLCECYDG